MNANWKDNITLGLLITAITSVGTFYIDWKTDEANEDAESVNNKNIMFDTPVDKLETKKHIESIDESDIKIKWAKDEMMQEKILEKLEYIEESDKKQDSLIRLNIRLSSEAKQAAENPH
jgi:hypothetical protein